jgi:hypothetical protein
MPLIHRVVRGYFEDISVEIEHAAQVDGYKWYQIFWKILLPLIKPGLVAAALLAFIFAWNNFTFSLLLTTLPHTNRHDFRAALYRDGHRTHTARWPSRHNRSAAGSYHGNLHSEAPRQGPQLRCGKRIGENVWQIPLFQRRRKTADRLAAPRQ